MSISGRSVYYKSDFERFRRRLNDYIPLSQLNKKANTKKKYVYIYIFTKITKNTCLKRFLSEKTSRD